MRCLDVAADGEDSIRRWYLQEEVCVVRYRHKLDESWSPKYGVVGGLERHHLKADGLDSIVIPSSEGDREGHHADRGRTSTRDDAVEGLVGGDQGGHVEASRVLAKMMLSPLPPSMSTLTRRTWLISGFTTRG